MKSYGSYKILLNEAIAEGIYKLELAAPGIASAAKPGQFLNLYTGREDMLLPRPISLCAIDMARGAVTLVYRVAGGGTEVISGMKAGDFVTALGPNGNGFPLPAPETKGTALLIGGGIGIPPLLGLGHALREACPGLTVVPCLGYRDAEAFLLADFKALGDVIISSDDGSIGYHGNIIDAIKAKGIAPTALYSCGPKPMLRSAAAYAGDRGIKEAYVSTEERMACGAGVCLGCAIKIKGAEAYKKVCAEGPVFPAADVVFE